MKNKEWYDLFQDKFKVSRSTARKMLSAIMKIKESDTFYNIDTLKYHLSGNVHVYFKERRKDENN
jgi:hypothetical protein